MTDPTPRENLIAFLDESEEIVRLMDRGRVAIGYTYGIDLATIPPLFAGNEDLKARAALLLRRAEIHRAIMRRASLTRGRAAAGKEELSRRLSRVIELLKTALTSS